MIFQLENIEESKMIADLLQENYLFKKLPNQIKTLTPPHVLGQAEYIEDFEGSIDGNVALIRILHMISGKERAIYITAITKKHDPASVYDFLASTLGLSEHKVIQTTFPSPVHFSDI